METRDAPAQGEPRSSGNRVDEVDIDDGGRTPLNNGEGAVVRSYLIVEHVAKTNGFKDGHEKD